MDSGLQAELNSCIEELDRISRELDDASFEVKQSIQGMSTFFYTWTLENCADRYRSAANQLRKIR